jgi:hypothetical protein
MNKKTPVVIIEVEGGLVQGIISDLPISAIVVDKDVEGATEDQILKYPAVGAPRVKDRKFEEVTATRWSKNDVALSPGFVRAARKSLKL